MSPACSISLLGVFATSKANHYGYSAADTSYIVLLAVPIQLYKPRQDMYCILDAK